MNGYNFTERVRKVLDLSRRAAIHRKHEYVGTEHMLLGVIAEGEGVAAAALQNLHVNLDDLQRVVDEVVKPGTGDSPPGPDLPFTSRAKKVLELAMSAASDLDHNYVGTEHLLLGLIREKKGIAAQILGQAGVNDDGVRAEVLRLLGSTKAFPPSSPSTVVSVRLEVGFADGSSLKRRFPDAEQAIGFLIDQNTRGRSSRTHSQEEPQPGGD